jgi:hypothetical protein
VRRFLTAHGDARFEAIGADADDKAPRIINRAGWKRRDGDGWLFLVAPDVFKAEVAAGLDADAVARALRAAGLLATDDDARLMRRVRLPGVAGLARVYAIKGEIPATAARKRRSDAGRRNPGAVARRPRGCAGAARGAADGRRPGAVPGCSRQRWRAGNTRKR